MAFVPLDRKNLPLMETRLKSVRPDSKHLWGHMTAPEMLAHLRRGIEISLGEHAVKDRSIPVVRMLIRWLTFNTAFPWPRGKIKAPAEWTPAPREGFEVERIRLLEAVNRFVHVSERDPRRIGVSPLFGPLPLSTWRRIHGKHFDHHLRQFGV